ncbi:pectin lyase-like protein [Westerdykella ornata]|uniref:Pectin lyase-like protein n=1 Tax=Westerdykella ornata TaxID=318751 RepID=A0A6A6JHS4_WESOR|nr:pectin lyase-like protein [Westerdykella ornata]KAF2275508.1 pectin lyase-like protein [Westerdykella ornata]
MIFNQLQAAVLLLGLQATAGIAGSTANSISKRDPCVPLANGFEAIDDSPAINDALKACGNGGTIVLPADQFYSIRSPIDFTPCKNCDFQIEGQLIVARGQWDYWRYGFSNGSVPAFFHVPNVHGARIHSVTGKGVIDGNAIEYYTTRYDSGIGSTISFFEIKNSSSDITIENLVMKNVMHRFIRAQGNSTNLTFRNLTLTMEEQWGDYPRNQYDAAGIELGMVSGVSISDITMAFSSMKTRVTGPVGICIPFDVGAHNIDVRRVTCKGAWGGVLVSMGAIDYLTSLLREPVPPSLTADTIGNIYVSDLTFSGNLATGIMSYWFDGNTHNVTWDGVTVLDGTPAFENLCYLKSHSNTPFVPNCFANLEATVTDVWFKRFRGNGLVAPEKGSWDNPGKAGYNNKTVIRVGFEDWGSL